MSNMSYCKFENTFRDLEDCYYSLQDGKSQREASYMKSLVLKCADIIEEMMSGRNEDFYIDRDELEEACNDLNEKLSEEEEF